MLPSRIKGQGKEQ